MNNKEYIKNELEKNNLKLGIYDKKLEGISKKKIDFLLDNVDSCEKVICINRKHIIVEIYHIDNDNGIEIDFNVITLEDYVKQYGDEIVEEGKFENLKEEYQKYMKK